MKFKVEGTGLQTYHVRNKLFNLVGIFTYWNLNFPTRFQNKSLFVLRSSFLFLYLRLCSTASFEPSCVNFLFLSPVKGLSD